MVRLLENGELAEPKSMTMNYDFIGVAMKQIKEFCEQHMVGVTLTAKFEYQDGSTEDYNWDC